MEAEERPNKIRKLENGSNVTGGAPDIPHGVSQDSNGPVNASELEPAQNSESAHAIDNTKENSNNNGLEELPKDAIIEAKEQGENQDPTPLSKNQQKKLKRQQEWEAGREDRKLKRKEQIKAKKERKRAVQQAEQEVQHDSPNSAAPGGSIRPRHEKATQLPITFIFDCSFDDLMLDKEMKSLASQLTRCYSDNKNALYRAHMTVSSFNGKLKDRFDTVLSKHHENWRGVRFFHEDIVEVSEKAKEWMKGPQGGKLAGMFAKAGSDDNQDSSSEAMAEEGEFIYLSSDSDVTLTHLKPYSTYVIGGLVDRNRHKGICHRKALELGVKTAKLPIGQYLEMKSRTVLATNHVSEIMLKWLECGDWGEAFMSIIPKRKGGTLRENMQDEEENEDEDGNENGEEGDADAGSEQNKESATEISQEKASDSPMKDVEQT